MPTRRRLSHPTILAAIIAAVAAVLAATIPVVIQTLASRAPQPTTQTPATTTAPVTGTTAPVTGMTAPATGATASAAPSVRALGDMAELDGFEGWSHEPQQVAGRRHEVVLATSPCWLNDGFTATFVVSRQFSRFRAEVGIADDARVAHPLRFTVLLDGKPAFETTVGLGRTRPVQVDIRPATQLAIRVNTTSTEQCHDDTTGVWINPQIHQ